VAAKRTPEKVTPPLAVSQCRRRRSTSKEQGPDGQTLDLAGYSQRLHDLERVSAGWLLSYMSQRQSQNYHVPEVSWQALLAVDWRGGLLVLLFLTTLLVLGLTAFVLGPGPEATVM
jgi:hypothetical protein